MMMSSFVLVSVSGFFDDAAIVKKNEMIDVQNTCNNNIIRSLHPM
jgi:hypothetical protein